MRQPTRPVPRLVRRTAAALGHRCSEPRSCAPLIAARFGATVCLGTCRWPCATLQSRWSRRTEACALPTAHRVLESLVNPAPPRRVHHRRTVAFPSCRASLPKAAPQAQLFASHSFDRPCPIRTGDADGILAGVSPTLPTQPPCCMCHAQATRRSVRVYVCTAGTAWGPDRKHRCVAHSAARTSVAAVDVACLPRCVCVAFSMPGLQPTGWSAEVC